MVQAHIAHYWSYLPSLVCSVITENYKETIDVYFYISNIQLFIVSGNSYKM